MSEMNLLTEASLAELLGNIANLHDSELKSFRYEYDRDNAIVTRNIHIKLSAEAMHKPWQDRWSRLVTLYLVFEHITYVNILKNIKMTMFQLIYRGKIGLLENHAFLSLDSDYPQTSLYDLKVSEKSNFIIIAQKCYWQLLPYEPHTGDIPTPE
jgi:hypothetical protein